MLRDAGSPGTESSYEGILMLWLQSPVGRELEQRLTSMCAHTHTATSMRTG